jgi:predicted GNAT family acetyltransferase
MAETDGTLDVEVRQSFIDDLVQQGTSQTDAAARYDQAMAYKPTPAPAPTPDPVKVAKPPEVKLPEPPQMKEVKPPKITSQYGDTKDRTRPHGGIDIRMPTGTPIPSLSSGTVTRIVDVDDGDRGGMRVFVRDDKGRETRYMHGSGFPEGLKIGQEIKAGQPVMISGATGRVTGPHLHLEVGNVNENGQFNQINPAEAYPQYFQTGAQPGAKPEVPEYLQPDFKLELPTMLNKLMATRQQMINGSTEGMSMQDQVARHARSIGLTADQFSEAVSRQGAGLEYMLDEVGRKGRNSFDVVEEAKKRGVSAFLDPSQRTAKVSKTAGGLRQKVVEYQKTGDPTALTGEFSSDIFKSKDAMPFLGGQAIDFAETAKPDERMYKIAALIAEGVMKDKKASDGVSAWSEQYFGAAKWAKSRAQQYLQRYGVTPGSANYEDEQRKYYQRSLRELSALKVVGLWTGPIMLPEADVFQSEGAKSLGDRFFDALSPTLEVVGIREEKGKPELVVRQENAFQYFFNMVDIAGAGLWGAVASYDSDQSVLEDVVEGIENRRNPLEAAMDSEFADINGYTKALSIMGGGVALIFTPDLLVGAGGVAKLTKKTLDAATTGRAATRAGELLGDVYKARTEGRFVDAAKIEGTLRGEFGQQGGIADLLDIMDAEAAKFIAKGNADILDPEFAMSLPGDLGKRLVAAHASLRKPMLARGKGQGKTMFAQYGGKTDADEVDLGLYETQALLDDIQEAREAMVALGATGRLPALKKQVLGNITLLRRQTGAKNDPEAARFIARLEESLVEAIENPKAWEKRFHGKNNLQSELAQIAALRGPTDEDIANATGKTLTKLMKQREDLAGVRERIHRQLGMITTKAKNVEDPVVVLDRAKAAVLANNESRASAAELLRRSVLGSHKIKPVTILPRPGDGELMEVSAYGSRFSDQIQGAYKLTDEQANAVASVMDARARAWGAVNGEDPSKYYDSVAVSGSAGRTEDLVEETITYEMKEVGNGLVEISTEELRKAGGFGLMFKLDGDVMSVKSVEVPEALRGRGIGQGLYLRAVKHAKSLNKGFSSDLAPSPEALEVYEALIKRGIPFERKLVDMPDGTQARQFVISAENMAKIDLGDLKDATGKASAAKKTSRSVDILSDNRAVLNAFTNPTFAGVVQGLSHVFRRDLDGHDLKVVEEWCNVKNGNWTDIAEAKWANGFEEYLASGRVANDSLKATFEKFRVWLAESYRAVIGRPQAEKIPDEVAAVLDKLLKEQPPNKTPLQSILDAMSVGDISKIEETSIDPYMFIAKEARKLGMKNSAPDSIMASLKKNGKVTFKQPIGGKKVWTDDDFAELQLKLETNARMSDEASLGTDISFRAAAQATARESPDEQIVSFLSNEGTLYAAARYAAATVLGGDTMGALRVLRPEARFGVRSVVTSVEQAYGDAITFVAESKYEGLEGLLRFLGGETSLKFRSGRDALSSGQDYMGAALDNIDEIFKQLDTVKVGVGKNRITALSALAKLDAALQKYPKNPAKGLEALSKGDSKNIADALQLLLRDQKNPIFDHLIESFKVGGALRPSEARLVHLLLQATGQVPSKAKKLRGAERARFVIDGIENIYSREEALRAAVLFAGHGQAKIGRDIWAGTGISLSKDLVTAFTSWLNGEKISSELIPQMHDLVRRYGMRPEFIDDAVLETGFYVPKIARERLMEALKKGTLRRDPNQRFTENHLHGLFGTLYRYQKTRMTRGGVVLRQRYFLMNTIDHFGQMAMVSGYRPALVSTIRLSTQNAMIIPGIAHALRVADKVSGKAVSEGARRILQSVGDTSANAIGKWLGVSKYRIEVNPILEGVARDGSTTFRLVDAKTGQTRVYKYQDIRDIAVQEGVFASFDTRALESSIKRGVNLQETALLSRLKDTRGEGLLLMEERIKDSAAVLTDIVSKTAETWSERERVGAMISLMEMGMEPRKAARLVIDGLFDYAGSMTKGDRNILVNLMFPFWAFQKNANRLVIRQMFSPQGAYRMGVLRRSYEATGDVLTELLYDRVADPYGLDVERMPSELQDNYWFLRKSIELGYGPLEAMRNTEEGEKILAEIEARYGPIDQIDAEKREFLERGYGSPSKVPQDIKDALRLVFAGVPTGYSDDLGSTVGPDNLVSLASHIQNRLQNLQPQTAEGERFADYYSPKPGKSAVRSYNRDRAGFFISPRMTEDARKFMLMAKNDPETGYQDEFIQVLFPDSTINAGFRHTAAALSMMWLTARSVYGAVTEDEDANIQQALLDSAIRLMGDPINSPIPAAALGAINATEGAPPRRIDPDLARIMRRMRDMGFPLPMVTIIPAEQDLINPDEPITLSAERAYMQGGIGSMLFSTSALGELNDIYVRWSKTPLEERMGMEGEILRWAESVAGLQVTRVSRTETAKREAPRFTSTTTAMPRPK